MGEENTINNSNNPFNTNYPSDTKDINEINLDEDEPNLVKPDFEKYKSSDGLAGYKPRTKIIN